MHLLIHSQKEINIRTHNSPAGIEIYATGNVGCVVLTTLRYPQIPTMRVIATAPMYDIRTPEIWISTRHNFPVEIY
jgi:hypothetical protein